MAEIQELRKRTVGKVIPTARPRWRLAFPPTCCVGGPTSAARNAQVAANSAQIGSRRFRAVSALLHLRHDLLRRREFQGPFQPGSLAGNVGPSFRWDILNYGRLVNNIRVQDARFQQLVVQYQNTVLQANAEAENALIGFLNAQQQVQSLPKAPSWAEQSLDLVRSNTTRARPTSIGC